MLIEPRGVFRMLIVGRLREWLWVRGHVEERGEVVRYQWREAWAGGGDAIWIRARFPGTVELLLLVYHARVLEAHSGLESKWERLGRNSVWLPSPGLP
jgi:hypothetical protein